ncbi:MAG: hypothetical protein ACR2P0_01565 [Acidimicrobiales bacterium]
MSARVLAIFALPAAAVAILFIALGFVWWPFFLLAVPAALLVTWLLWRRADASVLRSVGARPIAEREGARITNMVESLCLSAGIDTPTIMVVDDPARNLATISGRSHTLLATSGLLESLDPMETEGVVAHALSKITTGTAYYETLVASAGAAVLPVQRSWARTWGGGEAGVIRFDISGVGLTRYPPGLRSALLRIDEGDVHVAGADALGNAWLVPPTPERIPLEHRIEVLGEL